MASAKQKAAARKNIKKAQAALRRKRGGGRKRKSPKRTRRATSSPARRRRSAVAPKRRRRASIKKSFRRAKRGFIQSLTPERVVKAGFVASGLREAFQNSQKDFGGDAVLQAQQIIAPAADGLGAALLVDQAVDNLAPGFVGDLAKWHVGQDLNVTVRRLANAAPSLGGWALGIRRFLELREIGGDVHDENVFPRMAAMTSIRVRNTMMLKQGPVIASVQGRLGPGILASPGAFVAGGFAGSKVITSIRPLG